jgi:hypothetical protein
MDNLLLYGALVLFGLGMFLAFGVIPMVIK